MMTGPQRNLFDWRSINARRRMGPVGVDLFLNALKKAEAFREKLLVHPKIVGLLYEKW